MYHFASQEGLWGVIVCTRLRQYDDLGCLSKMILGHPSERVLWKHWRRYRTSPILMSAPKRGPFSPTVESWLDELGLPYIQKKSAFRSVTPIASRE